MKRSITLILAVAMLVMTGCQAGDESTGEPPEPLNTPMSSEQGPETMKLAYERSWMAQDQECWYTANNNEEGISCIYAISKADESERLVYQAEKASYAISNMALDIAGNYIYFLMIDQSDENTEFIFSPFQVCAIQKDGSDFSVLLTRETMPVRDDEIPMDLRAYDDCLLLKSNSRTLFLYDLRPAELKVVGDIVSMFGFHEDKLYYVSNWSLLVTDIDLKETQVLIQATNAWDKRESKNLVGRVLFVGDDLFYCQRAPYGIYQYLDGESKLIYDGLDINGDMSVFSYAGKLYFMREEGETDTGTLIQYDPQTENMKELLKLSDYLYVYKIFNGYLYYSDLNDQLQRVKIELQA